MKYSDQLRKIAATTALDGVAEAIRKVADEMDAEKLQYLVGTGEPFEGDQTYTIHEKPLNQDGYEEFAFYRAPLAPTKVQMSDEQKLNLITNWFAEDWAIEKAKGLLDDFCEAVGIPPQAKGVV